MYTQRVGGPAGKIRSWNAAHDGPTPLEAPPPSWVKPAPPPPAPDRAMVIARLEEAGAALLALQVSGTKPAGLKAAWPEYIRQSAESYGYSGLALKPALPDSLAISRMDEALGWLNLIPNDRYVLRRLVGARMMVSPRTGRYLYTWAQIARLLGCDVRVLRRWHEQGIGIICQELVREARPAWAQAVGVRAQPAAPTMQRPPVVGARVA